MSAWNNQQEEAEMAKSQKRSTREIRKPKATKAKPSVALASQPGFAVNALLKKPKDKL
jgi:hypothetical protein